MIVPTFAAFANSVRTIAQSSHSVVHVFVTHCDILPFLRMYLSYARQICIAYHQNIVIDMEYGYKSV